jgi:chromosome segregation ATPase
MFALNTFVFTSLSHHLLVIQIEDRGALAFKAAILERKPSLNLMIHGNLLSEATVATINEWLKRAIDNENQVEELPPKKPEEPKSNIQNEMLMKEIYFLRQQLAAQQSVNNDLQRQLDNSLLKITELEQKLARENHENLTLSETLKQCQLRLSLANDEIHNLTANFEKERNSILNEMLRVIREKENEIRELQLERDNLKDKVSKLTVSSLLEPIFVSLYHLQADHSAYL